jgi:hypothetical protein
MAFDVAEPQLSVRSPTVHDGQRFVMEYFFFFSGGLESTHDGMGPQNLGFDG